MRRSGGNGMGGSSVKGQTRGPVNSLGQAVTGRKRGRRGSKSKSVSKEGLQPNSRKLEVAVSHMASTLHTQQRALSMLASHPMMSGNLATASGFGEVGAHVDNALREGEEAFKAVKRLLNVESKRYQITGAPALSYTGTVLDLTAGIAQGGTDSQREGDSCKAIQVDLVMGFTWNAAGAAAQFIRWIVVRANDEAVTAAQVNPSDGTGYAPLAQVTWDNRFQYRILEEGYLTLSLYAPGKIEVRKHRLDSHVQWTGGSTTVTTGAIQVIWWTNTATLGPSVSYSAELTFVDN